ncbi:Uncharacterised protein [Serratia fonticola]|jgi:hypothetical protein|nr:Uncharacterised protein [Serratia fonticola]
MGTTKQGGGMFSPQVEGLPAHFGGRSWRAYPRVRGYTQLIVQRGAYGITEAVHYDHSHADSIRLGALQR